VANRINLKQLGELLVEAGLITKDQLKHALEAQKDKGGLIGQVLVDLGYVSEEAIAQAITAQYGFPYLPLENYEIDSEIVKIVPKNVAIQYCLIPVDKIGSNLTVAMANPLNNQAVEDIALLSGLYVQLFVSTATDIKKAIEKYYK
jgi:type IV pilus assembly protein PilB